MGTKNLIRMAMIISFIEIMLLFLMALPVVGTMFLYSSLMLLFLFLWYMNKNVWEAGV